MLDGTMSEESIAFFVIDKINNKLKIFLSEK